MPDLKERPPNANDARNAPVAVAPTGRSGEQDDFAALIKRIMKQYPRTIARLAK